MTDDTTTETEAGKHRLLAAHIDPDEKHPVMFKVAGANIGFREPRSAGRTRLTVDLPTEDAELLAGLAADSGFNKTTTLVRAIRLLGELTWAARKDGSEIIVVKPNGDRERLLLT